MNYVKQVVDKIVDKCIDVVAHIRHNEGTKSKGDRAMEAQAQTLEILEYEEYSEVYKLHARLYELATVARNNNKPSTAKIYSHAMESVSAALGALGLCMDMQEAK